ncbi:AAA family ATPase [Viridibacterium curvum]|uniref:SPOR domain-containing protein n=1 Tax=Viridibacterium curvum TaxID=1101404 RepID=A0ABP9Q8Q4_9RHOO
MYLEHFGLSEAPFRITPQTAWFYAGAQRGALLDALLYAIAHDEGIIKISGEVGVGKTMLCRMLIERLPANVQVIYLSNPSLTPEALLKTIALELGIADTQPLTVLRQIEQALIASYEAGKRVVAIIDEAHAMPRESLEQIRLLSNLESASRKLLQLVLFGQTELDELLALREMRSLHDRITQHFALGPLAEPDVAAYLRHRLEAAGYRGPDLFNTRNARLIAQASRGLTRRINILADKTLMAAFADKTRNIAPRHVRLAAQDARYTLPPARRLALPALGVLVGISALGLLGWWWLHSKTTTPATNTISAVVAAAPAVASSEPAPGIASSPAATSVPVATSTPPPVPAALPQVSAPLATPAAPTLVPQAVTQAGLGPISAGLLQASKSHIAQAPASRFFVQIQRVSEADAASLEAFLQRLRQAIPAEQTRLYSAVIAGKTRYGVIFGDFETAKEANAAIAAMPEWLRGLGIYPRQYAALK